MPRYFKLIKKILFELSYDPAIPLLGIYREKTKTLIQKDTRNLIFIAALFTIAKTWKPLGHDHQQTTDLRRGTYM